MADAEPHDQMNGLMTRRPFLWSICSNPWEKEKTFLIAYINVGSRIAPYVQFFSTEEGNEAGLFPQFICDRK
jgi:hypothetical protein